jgi:hypothetical protein
MKQERSNDMEEQQPDRTSEPQKESIGDPPDGALLGRIKGDKILLMLLILGLVVVAIKLFGSSVSEKFARANEVQPCLSMFFNKLPYEPERLEDVGMPDAEPDEEPRMSRSELLDRFDGRLPEDVLARLRGEFDTSG